MVSTSPHSVHFSFHREGTWFLTEVFTLAAQATHSLDDGGTGWKDQLDDVKAFFEPEDATITKYIAPLKEDPLPGP